MKRHEGLTDPGLVVEKPDFVLLDEAVGLLKRREAYVPMTGPVAQEGVGFDVWAVKEKKGQGLRSGAVDERKRALAAAMENMFDDWEFPDKEWRAQRMNGICEFIKNALASAMEDMFDGKGISKRGIVRMRNEWRKQVH